MDGAAIGLDPEVRRAAAAAAINDTWSLLERADRPSEGDDLMVHAAHAYGVAGDEAEAGHLAAVAHKQAAGVADDEDRQVLLDDLATLP